MTQVRQARHFARRRRLLTAVILALAIGLTGLLTAAVSVGGMQAVSAVTASVGALPSARAASSSALDTCGYDPTVSPVFNENTVTRAAAVYGTGMSAHIGVFTNDETALLLGVNGATPLKSAGTTALGSPLAQNVTYSQLTVSPALPSAPAAGLKVTLGNPGATQTLTVAAGSTTTTINVTAFKASRNYAGVQVIDQDPALAYGAVPNPNLGGNNALDATNRPQYPALFLTDLTVKGLGSKVGDWQTTRRAPDNVSGGVPFADAVYGTWATATQVGSTYTDTRPSIKNDWNLGPDADTPPNGTTSYNEGFGSEVVWNVSGLTASGVPVVPGHQYRLQSVTHDGDQNKTGGDVGEYCTTITIPGPPALTTDASGQSTDPRAKTVDAQLEHAMGSAIGDVAFVAPNAGFANPTGKVTFDLFFVPAGRSPADPCDAAFRVGDANFPDTEILAPGNPSTARSKQHATSDENALGTYYWRTSYDPGSDPNYAPTTDTCGVETDQMVDARIRLTPHERTNVVGNPHTVTAIVETTTDGVIFTNVSDAKVETDLLPEAVGNVDVSLLQPVSAFYVDGAACTTGSAGCPITINDPVGEDVAIHATSTFAVAGVLGTFTESTTSGGDCADETCDAVKHYVRPTTELTVSDRLIELGSDASGSVTYRVYPTRQDCLDGTNAVDATPADNSVVDGVAPLSVAFTVRPGNAVYFSARYEGDEGTFTTECEEESASVS